MAGFYNVPVDTLLGRDQSIVFDEHERSLVTKYRILDKRGKQTILNALDYEQHLSEELKKKKAYLFEPVHIAHQTIGLVAEEVAMLKKYRGLDSRGQASVLALIEHEHKALRKNK